LVVTEGCCVSAPSEEAASNIRVREPRGASFCALLRKQLRHVLASAAEQRQCVPQLHADQVSLRGRWQATMTGLACLRARLRK